MNQSQTATQSSFSPSIVKQHLFVVFLFILPLCFIIFSVVIIIFSWRIVSTVAEHIVDVVGVILENLILMYTFIVFASSHTLNGLLSLWNVAKHLANRSNSLHFICCHYICLPSIYIRSSTNGMVAFWSWCLEHCECHSLQSYQNKAINFLNLVHLMGLQTENADKTRT